MTDDILPCLVCFSVAVALLAVAKWPETKRTRRMALIQDVAEIRAGQAAMLTELKSANASAAELETHANDQLTLTRDEAAVLKECRDSLKSVAASLSKLVELLAPEVVGINVIPGTPEPKH